MMPWLWYLACFIIGVTVGAGLVIFILLTGTPTRSPDEN